MSDTASETRISVWDPLIRVGPARWVFQDLI
jgi:hypothetical protein